MNQKTDAIHCQVANNIITNVAFFLSTKKCRSLSLRRIQTVYSFNQNRDQLSVAQLCHNGGYIPLGIMNMTKNPDHGLFRALKLICCQRFKFSMVFCMIMMLQTRMNSRCLLTRSVSELTLETQMIKLVRVVTLPVFRAVASFPSVKSNLGADYLFSVVEKVQDGLFMW